MNATRNAAYWYGGALNKSYKYENLTKKELSPMSKERLQGLYNDYWEYYCNLGWEKESAVEYGHYKELKKYDKENERTAKNLNKIMEVYNGKDNN